MKKQTVLFSLVFCMIFTCSALGGIVAHWPLNEGSGQIVADVSGNGNDGILGDVASEETSDPAWVVDPERGNVLEWEGDSGDDQWVNLNANISNFSSLNQGSILAWIKMPADGVNIIFAASDSADASSELRFFHDPSYGGIPGLRYDIRENGTDTFFQLSSYPKADPGDNTWHHVAVTVDADGNTGLYVDGELCTMGQEVGFFNAVADIDSMSLGRNVDNSGPAQWIYMGLMSDVAVFNNPLAAPAIAAIYDGLDINEVGKMVWSGTPIDNSIHVNSSTTISWEKPEDAVEPVYDVYFSPDPNFPGGPISPGQTETTYDPGQLNLATTYYWRIDTIFSGNTYQGALSSFTTTGTVSDPVPVDGSVNMDTYTNLAWTGDDSIASYDVYFGTDPGALVLQGNVTEGTYDLPALEEFTEYFWRIDSVDAGGSLIDTGTVQSFTTGGIIAHWSFDEKGGILAADSVGDIDGEVIDAQWTGGIIPDANNTAAGTALSLGAAGWVDFGDPDLIEGRTSMTLSTWVRLDGPPVNGQRIMEHEDVFYYYIRGTRFSYENHGNSRVVSTTEPVPGNWYHVLITFDGQSQDMYINGKLESSSGGVGMLTSIYPMHIGCRRSAGGDPSGFINASIDDVRVYSNKFSAESVADLYNNTYLSKYPNPSDGQENIEVDSMLTWQAGVNSITHNVSLGTEIDPNGVVAIDSAANLTGTIFDPSFDLDLNTTYYWQVDEVDVSGFITKGNIWMFTTVPPKAYSPIPADEDIEVDPSIVLEWNPGAGGVYTHNVYFGTDPLDLALVSESQEGTTFDPLGDEDLEWNTIYYWAVDEVEEGTGTVFPGDVWSFTTINPICETPLAGDIDGDCMVTMTDLAIMASDWAKCNRIPARSCY